jgi:hypothetical protein
VGCSRSSTTARRPPSATTPKAVHIDFNRQNHCDSRPTRHHGYLPNAGIVIAASRCMNADPQVTSGSDVATIDVNNTTRHVARLIRCEKEANISEFCVAAAPMQRDLIKHLGVITRAPNSVSSLATTNKTGRLRLHEYRTRPSARQDFV